MTDNQDNPPSQPATKPKKSAPKAKKKPKGKPAPNKTPKPKAKGKPKSRKPSASPQEDRDTVASPSVERAGLFTVELGTVYAATLPTGRRSIRYADVLGCQVRPVYEPGH
jgi:outer membrane biosynthesis protein TonB